MNSDIKRKDLKKIKYLLDIINSRNTFFYYNSKTDVQILTRTFNNNYIAKKPFQIKTNHGNIKME